jgi:hypothetical protein
MRMEYCMLFGVDEVAFATKGTKKCCEGEKDSGLVGLC